MDGQRLTRRAFLPLAGGVVGALCSGRVAADDWPQWRGPDRDGRWREAGIVERFSGPSLPLRWRASVSNGYSGPTVAASRVYLMDRLSEPTEQERVVCVDARTGKPLWTHAYPCRYVGISYPDGPRASVTIAQGRAFALGTMGHLHCLDAASGKVLWQRDLNRDYRIRMNEWGISSSPLVEGDRVILMIGGSDGACLVALDCRTGQERWKALNDLGSYSSPIVLRQAGKQVVVAWTGERVAGLDPATGKLYWEQPFAPFKWVEGIVTPAVGGEWLMVTSFFRGSLMLRIPPNRLAAERVWERKGQNERNTDALHSLMSTPVIEADHVYGFDTFGQFRCLDARTGDRLWESQAVMPRNRNATAHIVRRGPYAWILNELGELIIAQLSPWGYTEISRSHLIKRTTGQLPERGGVVWSHPAFADGCVFARNDEELVCADLRRKS